MRCIINLRSSAWQGNSGLEIVNYYIWKVKFPLFLLYVFVLHLYSPFILS
jgi:hypothetical protein